ncbi:MAG TPA: NAD(P)/FAD-dependent oxidoreductase [Longimicrobiales bacterium]
MRLLIIGAGIGGPAAAVALRRAGFEPVLFEARQAPAESAGLFLTLVANGMRVLRELDLLDAVLRADVVPTPLMAFSSTTGKPLGGVPNGWLDDGTPSFTLMRGALQKALVEAACARGIEVHHGRRLTGYHATPAGVAARFDDGTEVEGDLLVGADGIHSAVRRAAFPDAPAPSYTGLLNLGGIAADSGLPPTPDTMHMVWGRRAFFGYTVRPDGEAWWFANVGQEREPARGELEAVPAEEWRRRLRELYADDPPFIAELIERTPRIGATPIHDMPSLPAWQRGRVVLLGDAAHAVSPSAGQGASQALEDAIVLAKCLRDVAPVEAALARYEALRRPRAERIVAEGRRRGTYKALESRAAVRVRDLLLPLAMRVFANERRLAWIHDYRVRWDEPVTVRSA